LIIPKNITETLYTDTMTMKHNHLMLTGQVNCSGIVVVVYQRFQNEHLVLHVEHPLVVVVQKLESCLSRVSGQEGYSRQGVGPLKLHRSSASEGVLRNDILTMLLGMRWKKFKDTKLWLLKNALGWLLELITDYWKVITGT